MDDSLMKLADEVLNKYDIKPEGIKVIQGGGIKTVWRVDTGKSEVCLKRLKQTMDKALFSVNAQIHVKQSGGLVPGIVRNSEGNEITEHQGQLFVLYEWMNGKDLNFSNRLDLCEAVKGLAAFHNATKGYKPVEGARISSKLGKWPEQYTSMLERMRSWGCNTGVDEMCLEAVERLRASDYSRLTAAQDTHGVVLCHQDYGRGNAIMTDKGVCVLDLDGVTFDLPARDLRKIIGKNAENSGQWQEGSIKSILSWYTEANPLDNEQIRMVLTDLMFPHWYFGLVKNRFQGGKQLKKSEIDRMTAFETDKMPVLRQMISKLG
jgi:spore coat protein I